MKSRMGFVSNSSSSSFIVPRSAVSEQLVRQLMDHIAQPIGEYGDMWEVRVTGDVLSGFTCMNNNNGTQGDLRVWMAEQGFPMDAVVFEDD